jgi:uncharacterized membrane protein (UPF0127 family)
MKRIAFVSMVAALTSASLGAQTPQPGIAAGRHAEVAFPDRTTVQVEVAETEAARERGLMQRSSLGELDGMIFVFDTPGLHAFWMKDTLIPLDMIWLDGTGKIVFLAESVPPCKTVECPTYPPRVPASYVLEVNAGFTKKHQVRVGDTVAVSGIDLKRPLPQ